ncbi:hypothetical protein BC939DRAFT_452025 [Gamsiella multidivaricata]|uniref:uncharacterized protein n=1 Tax=Gamsiella multidivaricata TaxID=101098 RepID=UPI0022211EA1|nr:uncharacterized protein BC939DRAFT_452025 [Gamsiella multidivaricata]KAG0366316.1 hypothetical protein BGZ54_005546 [Gamsiella multidivaricata]KAI7823170.1 hypothetical protein BC939DRAFT_452025 [Gamsiella multidivaricata]
MGCKSSKHLDNGSSVQHSAQAHHQQQQPAYGLPQQMLPPSTLPQGWVSQFDANKQRLYYVYPQTGLVTWTHPLGAQADAQEMARFNQIRQLQQQQYGSVNQSSFADSYNRQGGMGAGAGLAMGMMAGGAMGLMAGSMLTGGMHGGYSNDVIPASTDYGGGDFGGGDFGGGDFGGGDFGF